MSKITSRCNKSFKNTADNTIDLNAIKDFKAKFGDNKIYENFKNYKENQIAFDKKKGWFYKTGCKEYLNYNNPRTTLNKDKDKKMREKYSSEISNCKTYKLNKEKYYSAYIKSLSTGIKKKIIKKLKKTLKNPKDSRMNRLSCYIQMLIDLSNSKDCRSNISIKNILDKFNSTYVNKIPLKKSGAVKYLEYLLTKTEITDEELKLYKKWFGNVNNSIISTKQIDEEFIKALTSVLEYFKC